jgi:hypothetical protein
VKVLKRKSRKLQDLNQQEERKHRNMLVVMKVKTLKIKRT